MKLKYKIIAAIIFLSLLGIGIIFELRNPKIDTNQCLKQHQHCKIQNIFENKTGLK